jgi:hypothetical protein
VLSRPGRTPATRTFWLAALLGWVWARVCVSAGFWIAHLVEPDPALAAREDFPLPRGLLSWDGFFYERIATAGYAGTPPDGVRFFPVYPLLGRWLSPLFLGRVDVALVVLNNAAALIGAVLLARLAFEVLSDRPGSDAAGTAVRSAWVVAIIPASIALVWAYTEGLALCATALTLLALHRRAFAWAGIAAAAAAALRPTGVLLVVPIAVEVLRPHLRGRPRLGPALAALAGPVLGLAASLAFIARTTGDWLAPFDAQRPIRGDVRNPLVRAAESVWGLFHNTDTELVPFVVLWGLLVLVAVRRRQPLSWIAFSAATLLVALSSQTIDSIGRYGLLAVPLVVALAQWSDRRVREAVVAAVGSAGLVVYTAQALLGRIVP